MRFITSYENVTPRFQTLPILPFPPHPPRTDLLIPLKNSTATTEEFYYSFYFTEGIEN